MVFFGTGRYFVKGDSTNLDIQSFYGVLDRDGEDTLGRGDLWTQSVVFEGAMGSQEVRVTSGNPPDWSAKRGWVMDLLPPDKAAHGERVIAPPLLRYGRVIFNTILPSADDPCHQGSGWLMELDAATGANLSYAALDINGDGEFTTDDAVAYTDALGNSVSSPAAGVKSGSMSLNQPTVVTAGNKEYKFTSNVDGGIGSVTEKTSSTMGRTSWRQLQ
jgi:type IV pilus assembly protein PilY1